MLELEKNLEETVYRRMLTAGVELSDDVHDALKMAFEREESANSGSIVLENILKNLAIAKEKRLPMCQDTGMVLGFVDIGEELTVSLGVIKGAIERGIERAYEDGSFRKSVVAEPVFDRDNTKTNLPAVIYFESVPGDTISVHLLMKGFGSENCSGLEMLNPTKGPSGVEDAVVSIMGKAGGKPCPPVVVGVGIGGTSDRAAILSKRALTRKVGTYHQDPRYAGLERSIFDRIQGLGVGAGGLGGIITTLGVMIESEATHIAGMPVAVSINCWADRKAEMVFDKKGALQ